MKQKGSTTLIPLSIFFFFFITSSFAQNAIISGTILDEKGEPVSYATVILEGTQMGANSNDDGSYEVINVPPGTYTVKVSYVGYLDSRQQVMLDGSDYTLNVTMKPTFQSLNEVVVVGYQTQKRSSITGAVSNVNSEQLAKLPVGNVDQALQGKASGVRVTQNTGQPGEGVTVRIRGVGTINNNDPLFVIDGVPTKDGINFLSSNDIESITILKDAASAAIYGARSANGVVLITTKSGKKGTQQVNYSTYVGMQTHGYLTPMANADEYVQLFNESVVNDNMDITNPLLQRDPIPDSLVNADTDWMNAIFQNAFMQNHQLSLSGGAEKVRYYLSGNYFDQEGILLNSWFKKYSLLSKLSIDLSKKITVSTNIDVSYSKRNIVGSSGDGYGGNGGSVVRYAFFRTPPIPIFNPDGSYTDLPDHPEFFGDGYNPVALAEYTDNKQYQSRVFGDVNLEYKIINDLKFRSDFGIDGILTDSKRYDKNYGTNNRINSPSRLTVASETNVTFIWNNTLTYNKTFNGIHNFTAIAGTEAISNSDHIHGGSDHNFPEQISNLLFLGNGLNITSQNVFEGKQEWALFSLFGNINYSYNDRYLASFTVRRDGSSRFSPENRYGTFFSGSAGWNLHNEAWLIDFIPSVSKLRLRASYGELGNQDIGNYPWASIVTGGYNYVFGDPQASNLGYTVSTRGNENVQWESSTQADVGLDIGLFQDVLGMAIDYYVKTTSNMLIPIPLPAIGGSATTPYVNAGEVRNQGLEVELNYGKTGEHINYNINANFATLKNEVISLANGAPIPAGRIDNGVFATLTAVGQPIGSFYLLEMEGIFQNEADIFGHAYQGAYIKPGDVKFKDQNADGVIDEKDRVFLGSAIPKFIYGLTGTIEFHNFDLSVFFQGAYGNKLYLQVNHDIEGFYRAFNLTKRVYDEHWTGEGTSNTMPRVSWLGSTNNKTPSSRFLEDGSYVRLKNIQLGYNFPSKMLDKIHVKGLRIYLTSENLFTITKYTGLDPEMTTSDNLNAETYKGDVASGIDWGTYPSARSYIIGANLNF